MKIDVPENICEKCYDNLSEITVFDHDKKKKIKVCAECFSDFYEEEIIRTANERY